MNKLSKESFEKAKEWIENNARPLEKARLQFHFGKSEFNEVLVELKKFQNSDGGFGNAIEPDLRANESSVLGTSIAFQIIRERNLKVSNNIIIPAIQYLLKNYDKDKQTWRTIPKVTETSPHAPWWNQTGREESYNKFSLNPTAEILGYLYDFPEKVPDEISLSLSNKILQELKNAKTIEMHDFLCCKRLLETKNISEPYREDLLKELIRLLDTCLLKDPSKWKDYGLRPLRVCNNKNSLFLKNLKNLVEKNLDYEIKEQTNEGTWIPSWSWDDNYPQEWEKAKKEWTGVLTLKQLIILNEFKRID